MFIELTSLNGRGGRLPFDLPRSDKAVADSSEDVPFDTHDPLFRAGHGSPDVVLGDARSNAERPRLWRSAKN
jgi:hypothetical protein